LSLADELRERTKEAHSRAERHLVQGLMISGRASRAEYAAWLVQMLRVWRAVDAGLATVAARDRRVAAMVKPYHAHAHRIEADLKFLGEGTGIAVVPAAERLQELVRADVAAGGIGVVGVWYVLEGSANGGRFIAKAMSRGLRIVGPEGLMSLDPHGERQRELWQAWRADLDAQHFNAAEREAILRGAIATFDGVYEIMEEMGRVGVAG
jgi:heme oxygenase